MEMATWNLAQAQGDPDYRQAVVSLLYALADDDLTLGHRDSEWLGVAPEIEEDIAFSSIAQDEVGHATFYYNLLADLGEGTADALAFARPVAAWRNAPLAELDNGDWAFTIARHYFYDVFEDVRLSALVQSSYEPLRHGARKVRREEHYHLLHLETWFRRLALAGGEAADRLESAVVQLWPHVSTMFDHGDSTALHTLGILPAVDSLEASWRHRIGSTLTAVGLPSPLTSAHTATWRRDAHSDALDRMLRTMREVYDLDRHAIW